MLPDGDAGRARPVDDGADLADVLAHDLQGVHQRRGDDDGRAVLVVVEHGDVAQVLELPLDLKAAGGGDVL